MVVAHRLGADVLVAKRLPILSQEIEGVVVGELLLAEQTHDAPHAAPLRRGDPLGDAGGIYAVARITGSTCAEDEFFTTSGSSELDHYPHLKPSIAQPSWLAT